MSATKIFQEGTFTTTGAHLFQPEYTAVTVETPTSRKAPTPGACCWRASPPGPRRSTARIATYTGTFPVGLPETVAVTRVCTRRPAGKAAITAQPNHRHRRS